MPRLFHESPFKIVLFLNLERLGKLCVLLFLFAN